MIVCSTASGGLFSGETCTALVLTDATGQNLVALNEDKILWRAPSTSHFSLSRTTLSSSVTLTAARRINGNSSPMHWESCAHFGPIDQSADQRERQTYDSQKVWSTLLLRGSRWISLICSIWFYKLLYITDAPPTSRLALKFLFVYSCTEGGFTPIAQKQQQTLSHTCWYFPGWCS